jgi:Protein of unknown function (DUF3237)
MKLKPLMTLRATLRQPADAVGETPFGQRGIAEVVGGSFEGERLKGRVVTPGADWYLLGRDGVLQVDVRATLETDDGAFIYAQYFGKLHLSETATAAMAAGRDMAFGDTYFMTQPRFETGSEKYAWLNSIVAVAEGRLVASGVEYHVFECQHG